jgi:hypothetical protein
MRPPVYVVETLAAKDLCRCSLPNQGMMKAAAHHGSVKLKEEAERELSLPGVADSHAQEAAEVEQRR